jgi:hypothetical protein
VLEILERNCSSVFLPLPKPDVLKSHVEKKKVTGIAGRDYLSPHDYVAPCLAICAVYDESVLPFRLPCARLLLPVCEGKWYV